MALSCSQKNYLHYYIEKFQNILNCLNFFRKENKFRSNEKVCKNKDFCGIVMSSEKDKILEFKQYMKSDKMPYIIYADIFKISLIKNR